MVLASYGGFTINVDMGSTSFDIKLGEAASSLYKETGSDLEFSYAGRVNTMSFSDLLVKLSGTDDIGTLLQYINIGSPSPDVLFMGTMTSGSRWEYGLGIEATTGDGLGGFSLGRGIFTVDPEGMHLLLEPNLPLFDSVGLAGDLYYDGAFAIRAWAEADHSYSAGILELNITFDANIELEVNSITDWHFIINGYFYGEACADFEIDEICVSVEIDFGAEISSTGFEVSVGIGVDGVGFDVSMEFGWDKNGKSFSKDSYKIIPIKDVPVENRYYSEKYQKTNIQIWK